MNLENLDKKRIKVGDGLYLNVELHRKLLAEGKCKASTLESARKALEEIRAK